MTIIRFSTKLLFLIMFLTGCGKGGKDNENSGNYNNTTLTLESNVAHFSSGINQTPDVESVTILGSISQPENRPYYLIVNSSSSKLLLFTESSLIEDVGIIKLLAVPPQALGSGVYTETISISACLDPTCTKHIKGSPQSVSIRYEIFIWEPTVSPRNVDQL